MASFSWPLSPTPSGGTGGAAQANQVATQLERQFGRDIYFVGDYVLTASGDYMTLSGFENLRQAIYRRLITRPGEYKFVPEYGVGVQDYVKRKNIRPVIDELSRRIEENLLRDARIESVEAIDIEAIDDGIKIGIKPQVAGQALRFRPFIFKGTI